MGRKAKEEFVKLNESERLRKVEEIIAEIVNNREDMIINKEIVGSNRYINMREKIERRGINIHNNENTIQHISFRGKIGPNILFTGIREVESRKIYKFAHEFTDVDLDFKDNSNQFKQVGLKSEIHFIPKIGGNLNRNKMDKISAEGYKKRVCVFRDANEVSDVLVNYIYEQIVQSKALVANQQKLSKLNIAIKPTDLMRGDKLQAAGQEM